VAIAAHLIGEGREVRRSGDVHHDLRSQYLLKSGRFHGLAVAMLSFSGDRKACTTRLTLPLGNTLYLVYTRLLRKEVESNDKPNQNQRCVKQI